MTLNRINYGVEIALFIILGAVGMSYYCGYRVGQHHAPVTYEWIQTLDSIRRDPPTKLDRNDVMLKCVDENGKIQTISTIMGAICSDFDPRWHENETPAR